MPTRGSKDPNGRALRGRRAHTTFALLSDPVRQIWNSFNNRANAGGADAPEAAVNGCLYDRFKSLYNKTATKPSLVIVPARFKSGTLYSQIPSSNADFTVTRATAATRVNASGFIDSVASGIPRLDYFASDGTVGCPALLVEPAATNSISNNSMSGAVTGTPGTLPTNFSTSLAGLTRTIVGTGTENGVSYMDIHFSGTSTGGGVNIQAGTSTFITAASGQVWTHSVYAKLIQNSLNMPTARIGMYEQTSGGTYLTEGSNAFTLTSSLNRFSFTRTLTNASTARVTPIIQWFVSNGVSYDFTIRIGYPQMETGSVATSVIPTTTVTGSRSADVISVSGAVSGSIGQQSGTMYAEVDIRNLTDGRILTLFNSSTRYIFLSKATNRLGGAIVDTTSSPTTVVNLQTASGSLTAGTYKLALAYASGDFAFYVNGTQVATSATGGVIGGYTILRLGNFDTSLFFNDRIRAAALYTTRLTNDELATLTKL